MGDLNIPNDFLYSGNSSEAGFSSKPGSCISPQRLINGQQDFYIHSGETAKPVPKVLIINNWQALLWTPVLKKMSAAGFSIVCPDGHEFKPLGVDINEQSKQMLELFGQTKNPKGLQQAYCRKYEANPDQVMVVDEARWSAFIKDQDKDAL